MVPWTSRPGARTLTAFVSRDDGASWEGGLLLDERATVSYPDGTQAADGLVRVIYDWNRSDEKHILMTTFTEDDVLAGRNVSGRVRQRVLVNHATGVNTKPWRKDGRFLRLKKNDDGVPFVTGPRAETEPVEGEIRRTELGKTIFSNRTYVFHDMLPEALRGRPFVLSTMEKSGIRVTKPGVVHVLTPLPPRNRDTQADALAKQGFQKVAMREFVLFPSANGHLSGGNAVSVFQREMKAGETLELGKWAVILP